MRSKLPLILSILIFLIAAGLIYLLWQRGEERQRNLEELQNQFNIVEAQYDAASQDMSQARKGYSQVVTLNGNFQQVASNIIHLDGIQQFYRGMYAMCLIKNGVAQGVQPDPAVLNGCQTEVEAHMNKNLHQYIFKKLVGWRVPKGFNFKIPPAEVVVPLLPFKNLDPTKQFEPQAEPSQQDGPIPAPSLPERKHKGAGVGA